MDQNVYIKLLGKDPFGRGLARIKYSVDGSFSCVDVILEKGFYDWQSTSIFEVCAALSTAAIVTCNIPLLLRVLRCRARGAEYDTETQRKKMEALEATAKEQKKGIWSLSEDEQSPAEYKKIHGIGMYKEGVPAAA
eukprot:GHVT01045097.1.p2 GENE.GHVT01045097.1~~GHVT01045097.1.p2  ORF type:complete len:136 (-),score=26.35 GHVT01045097.1:372-779(-)